jgi:hypothetical protein
VAPTSLFMSATLNETLSRLLAGPDPSTDGSTGAHIQSNACATPEVSCRVRRHGDGSVAVKAGRELVATDSAFLSVGFSLDVKSRSVVAAIVGA